MNKKKSNTKEYMKILAPNFEDMESVLDSCGHELINEVNIAYEKLGKDNLWELTDKFLQFQRLLHEQIKEICPDHNFKNF
jgi:hypothetical protein